MLKLFKIRINWYTVRWKDSADLTKFTVHAVLLPSEPYKCSHGISTWKGSLDELKDDDRTVVRSHFTLPPSKKLHKNGPNLNPGAIYYSWTHQGGIEFKPKLSAHFWKYWGTKLDHLVVEKSKKQICKSALLLVNFLTNFSL